MCSFMYIIVLKMEISKRSMCKILLIPLDSAFLYFYIPDVIGHLSVAMLVNNVKRDVDTHAWQTFLGFSRSPLNRGLVMEKL